VPETPYREAEGEEMLNITENIKSLLLGEWEKIDFSSVNNDK
jgi:hypothetical protein